MPAEIAIDGLQPDTQYFYRLSTREGSGAWSTEPERSFRTQRPPGSTFTFDLEADPHNRDNVPDVWKLAMTNMLADNADFLLDLGAPGVA
mgnify:CR=1 FL=1